MNDIKNFVDWKGPFAETPSRFYKKWFELFKQFLEFIKDKDLEFSLTTLKVEEIYGILIQKQSVVPIVENKYPLINFRVIYKALSKIHMQPSDLNFAYKLMHRAINVKAKLKTFKMINEDSCPLCFKVPETIAHFSVHCSVIQQAKHFLERIIQNTVQVQCDESSSLECVYSHGLQKFQTIVIHISSILLRNAIWKHRNEVVYLNKEINASAKVAIVRCKFMNF